MSARKVPVSVDVWRSPNCRTEYSISVCNDDGDEIVCIGGDDDFDAAWQEACAYADWHGLTARCVSECGETLQEWRAEVSK